jgi:membrane protease YdiL (CAAX protease family)
MDPSTKHPSDSLRQILAWLAVIGSTLPEIIWRESGHRMSFGFVAIESIVLLAMAGAVAASPRLRDLTRFILALAAINFAWDFVVPELAQTNFIRTLSGSASWGGRMFFIARVLTLSGAVLGGLTLIGSGLTRRDLYLCWGNFAAPAQPIRFLGLRKPVPWTWFGPALLLVFALALCPFLYATVHPSLGASGRLVRLLPWMFAVAALNAASEEFQFRSLLLAHLRNIFRPGEAVLLTAAYFGFGHFYGQPSGMIGLVMAAIAGWIWGRSMIETKGFGWAFLTHMVMDMIIFAFLALGAQS